MIIKYRKKSPAVGRGRQRTVISLQRQYNQAPGFQEISPGDREVVPKHDNHDERQGGKVLKPPISDERDTAMLAMPSISGSLFSMVSFSMFRRIGPGYRHLILNTTLDYRQY